MKNKFRKNLGITLIALVVTIVVLLILAGISISMLTGQNGILNRATEAKEKTEKAQIDESDKMVQMEAMVKAAGKSIPNPSNYGENPNAQATADGAGKYFALPDGAKYITGTDTGVVVEIKGSEFVWVPVDDVVLDNDRVDELPTSSNSSEKNYTPIAVKVGDDYKGLLYNFDESTSWLMYGSNENYQGNETDYREPDEISSDTEDYKSENITKNTLQTEFNKMISSVMKYKGFYIARYEAGLDNTTKKVVFKNAKTTSGVTTLSASSSSANMWYGLYQKMASFAETNDKFVTNMIWGSQYDAMMNWMAKKGKTVGTADSTKTNTDKNMVTGSSSDDVINNVYDLYGCHYEWTLEADLTNFRACRGGDYGHSLSLAYRSDNDPNNTGSRTSSRATLYIE